jgi:hypothetical protein
MLASHSTSGGTSARRLYCCSVSVRSLSILTSSFDTALPAAYVPNAIMYFIDSATEFHSAWRLPSTKGWCCSGNCCHSLASLFIFYFFHLLPGIQDDPHQFLISQVFDSVVLPRVVGLEACHQTASLMCSSVMVKIHSLGLSTSGHRLLQQLLDYNFMLGYTFPLSILIDGHQGVGFSDQFLVEISTLFGTTIWVSRDALLELSVFGRLAITDFIACSLLAHD